MKLKKILLLSFSIFFINVLSSDQVENRVTALEQEVGRLRDLLVDYTNDKRFLAPEKYEEYKQQVKIDNENAQQFFDAVTKISVGSAIVLAVGVFAYKKYCEKKNITIKDDSVFNNFVVPSAVVATVAALFCGWIHLCDKLDVQF